MEAICGNDTGSTPDELADSVFGGEVEEADRLFHDLVRGGEDAGRLLGTVHGQALRLAEFRLAIDRGATAEQAALAEAIAGRCLLSLARKGLSLRLDR